MSVIRSKVAFRRLVRKARRLAGVPLVRHKEKRDEQRNYEVQQREAAEKEASRFRKHWEDAAERKRMAEEREEADRALYQSLWAMLALFRADGALTPAT